MYVHVSNKNHCQHTPHSDARNTRIPTTFEYTRMLEHARVIDDKICFASKTSYDIYSLFGTRYELFKRVYSHKTAKAIEYMICDILTRANDYFDIVPEKGDFDVKRYLQLTDEILQKISNTKVDHSTKTSDNTGLS